MHRMQSPYGRRLVDFHRQHDIPPRSSSPAPVTSALTIVPPTRASKPRRPAAHPLLIVFAIMTVLGLAMIGLEFARAIAREAQVLGEVSR